MKNKIEAWHTRVNRPKTNAITSHMLFSLLLELCLLSQKKKTIVRIEKTLDERGTKEGRKMQDTIDFQRMIDERSAVWRNSMNNIIVFIFD